MSVSSRCTTVTCMPRSERPCAASRPNKPPPMTTARRPAPERSSMLLTSSRSRNVTTPGSSLPGSGSMMGSEPVAMSSRSYGATTPFFERTVRRLRSISTIGIARMQRDAAARVPVGPVQHDVVGLLLAGEHRRQQDAVVVAARLGAEHGDGEAVGDAELEQLFDRAHAGHAIARHHQARALLRVAAPRRMHAPVRHARRYRR